MGLEVRGSIPGLPLKFCITETARNRAFRFKSLTAFTQAAEQPMLRANAEVVPAHELQALRIDGALMHFWLVLPADNPQRTSMHESCKADA